MANTNGVSNGVRFTIAVPNQSKALGITVYIANVASNTLPSHVRAALAKAIKHLAATPQLAVIEQDVTQIQAPASGQL